MMRSECPHFLKNKSTAMVSLVYSEYYKINTVSTYIAILIINLC